MIALFLTEQYFVWLVQLSSAPKGKIGIKARPENVGRYSLP
jgi:hypothetical protein